MNRGSRWRSRQPRIAGQPKSRPAIPGCPAAPALPAASRRRPVPPMLVPAVLRALPAKIRRPIAGRPAEPLLQAARALQAAQPVLAAKRVDQGVRALPATRLAWAAARPVLAVPGPARGRLVVAVIRGWPGSAGVVPGMPAR